MWVAFGGNTTRDDFIMLAGDYSKEKGKKIIKAINKMKLDGMELVKLVDAEDLGRIIGIIADSLYTNCAEYHLNKMRTKSTEEEKAFLKELLRIERNHIYTVEEILEKYDGIKEVRIFIYKDQICCWKTIYVGEPQNVPEELYGIKTSSVVNNSDGSLVIDVCEGEYDY